MRHLALPHASQAFPSHKDELQVIDGVKGESATSDEVLLVRRPILESLVENTGSKEEKKNETRDVRRKPSSLSSPSMMIDAGLEEFAKKMPMFEPEKIAAASPKEKPLQVNLDLALYRAKALARKFKYQNAEEILQKCIAYWPEDGRSYVALGKVLSKQSKMAEARKVYEKGCQATQGENAYIWQCWAMLEYKIGNTRKARELFDAATVADKRHVAAWHGWAMLELNEGNLKKSTQLLAKGIKFTGGNEYIYQTLALLEAKAGRVDQARGLFKRATKFNPRSCASWLAWAQMEMHIQKNPTARRLFERAIKASPKNRFAWHMFGLFEANLGNVEKARKLLKIGHALNPKDPVLLQSLALLEYKHSTANLARVLFTKASEIDPDHQAVWFAWGWMEWKEGNIGKARELYETAISIDSQSDSAARCLQAWGVLEQREGNLAEARKLFKLSLNVNSQSYITWSTWAQLEEDQGNPTRADEIRNLYFQQRTELVDDPNWISGILEMFDPALESLKRLMNGSMGSSKDGEEEEKEGEMSSNQNGGREMDIDAFIWERLSMNPRKLDVDLVTSGSKAPWRSRPAKMSNFIRERVFL